MKSILRHVLMIGSVLLGTMPFAANAQQSAPLPQEWQQRISAIGCEYYELNEATADLIWAFASAFSGQSLIKIGENAGYNDLESFFRETRSINNFSNRDELLQNLLAGTPSATRNLRAEVDKHGDALCPALTQVAKAGLAEIARLQIEERDYWQPHSELAQLVIVLKGCGQVDVDGFFGPASRTAWGQSGLKLTAGNLPTPGDIAQLAASKVACGSPAVTPILNMMDDCKTDFPAYHIAMLRLINSNKPNILALLEPAIACHKQRLGWNPQRYPGDLTLMAEIVETLPLRDDSWASASSSAQEFAAIIGPEESEIMLAAIGLELIARNGTSPKGLVGLAMLAQATQNGFTRTMDLEYLVGVPFTSAQAQNAVSTVLTNQMDYANIIIGQRKWDPETFQKFAIGPLQLDAFLSMDATPDFMRLVVTIDRLPQLRQALLNGPYDQLNYAFGSFILEGFTPTGRDPSRAREHFEAAAGNGHAPSMFRLALMSEFGLGGPVDPQTALALYQNAAALGESASALTLAERFETGNGKTTNWERAALYYNQAVAAMSPGAAANAIFGRLIAQSGFWQHGAPGGALLDGWATRALVQLPTGEDNGERDWKAEQARDHYRLFAQELATKFADAESGLALDMHRAAQWLRVSNGNVQYWQGFGYGRRESAPIRLRWILQAHPELAAHPLEAQMLLDETTPEGIWHQTGDIAAVTARMANLCSPETLARAAEEYRDDECLSFLHRAGIGAIAPDLIAPAFETLVQMSDTELAEIKKFGRLVPITPETEERYSRPQIRYPDYSHALIDVLAFYGDYRDAGHRAQIAKGGDLSASVGPLRRQVARAVELGLDMPDLERLLVILSRSYNTTASELLATLRAPHVTRTQPTNISATRVQFDRVAHLTSSRAIANTARRLSPLEAEAGNRDRAIELELIALQSDMTRHTATTVRNGPMAARLAEVCTLSRSSERLFALDAREIALTLAKQAVNTLQELRRDISALPEHVQLCFRAQVEGHYRWLADLFIAENRPDEASRVLTMLKNFENFEFANRSDEMIGASYETLPMMPEETALAAVITRIEPPQNQLATRRAVLKRLANQRDLDETEQQELQQLNEALDRAARRRSETRAELMRVAEEVGRADANSRLDPGKSIKRYLRKGRSDKAAILQYVVLPDRMGLVLSTATHQRVWGWTDLEGAPFSDKDLNALIGEFRTSVKKPSSDPRDLGKRLYDILLPTDVMAEIRAAGIETLILSLDGQLRYVPMAALYDGNDWLATNYTLTHVIGSGITASDDERSTTIAAFGTTKSHREFPALPGVKRELSAIMREFSSDRGDFNGRARSDDDFTRQSFVNSLIFSDIDEDRLGIVHLASHFKFGTNEDQSFLLLGNGNNLTVRDIREGMGQDADFTEVALLTLSACETAYGETDADGRELESFAAIAHHQGARAVMASIWPVSDNSTAALMVAFYRFYGDGLPVAQSLRNAQLSLLAGEDAALPTKERGAFKLDPTPVAAGVPAQLSGWRHPYYWAPFIILEGNV